MWKYLAISIVVVAVSLYTASRLVSRMRFSKKRQENEQIAEQKNELRRFDKAVTFIFGILLMQGLNKIESPF